MLPRDDSKAGPACGGVCAMAEKGTRNQIVEAADALFYQHGFEYTSFAHIASAVGISRGNFYHHFKSKDDILAAVIAHRLQRTEAMLQDFERDGQTPKARIRCFIRILITNRHKIERFGCPVGTLSTELAKLDHQQKEAATGLFTLFRDFLREQFLQLGRRKDADVLALHLLARSQGVATLAVAFDEPDFIETEVQCMFDWLDAQLAPPTAPRKRRKARR